MSNAAITWAYRQKTGSVVSKAVLVKLADNANDDGRCWPSIKRISRQIECSDSTVQEHIKKLEGLGFLQILRQKNGLVNLANTYILPIWEGGPGAGGVVREPDQGVREPDQGVVREPVTNPNIRKPSKNPKIESLSLFESRQEVPKGLNNDSFLKVWTEFQNHRKKLRKPLTDYGKELILKQLAKSPNEAVAAIELSIKNGWIGVDLEWLHRSNGQTQRQKPPIPYDE